jgi:hypothetical protein
MANREQRSFLVWLILGPAGAGKSSFGEWIATKRNWLHLEVDRADGDGIDLNNLRREWDDFWQRTDASPLRKVLRRRCIDADKAGSVLTFASNLVLSVDQIAAARQEGIETFYLYGSAAHCIASFLKREKQTGRRFGLDHWLRNNHRQYMRISEPLFAPCRIHVFTPAGARRAHLKVFESLFKGQCDASHHRDLGNLSQWPRITIKP